MLVVVNLLIVDQQQYTGGFNGITDLAQLTIGGIVFDAYNRTTFYLIATVCGVALLFGYVVSRTKFGLILQAIRENPTRMRLAGNGLLPHLTASFAISAVVAGMAGAVFTQTASFVSLGVLAVDNSIGVLTMNAWPPVVNFAIE